MAEGRSRARAKRTAAGAKPERSLRSIPGYLSKDGPPQLDRLVQGVRLGIMSALAVNDSLSFKELKQLLKTTDGNLSVHARKLEDAGYVECTKTFEGWVPRTWYRLSEDGRSALEDYLGHMEALIRAMRD